MEQSEEWRLEDDLRKALKGLTLVCEAEITESQIQLAGEVVHKRLRVGDHPSLARRFPACLATYFVGRGSEVYDRNELWPGLGVHTQTSKAGQAFLSALRWLGLPTFERHVDAVAARRYVAPILIHGALPATVAHQLVTCVEEELRHGVVDAEECRRHLLRRPDLVQLIRRPAARLLEWVPEYAERLIDAVIDHIEQPSGDALSRLPIHLQAALRQDADRRRDLRRLQVPRLEFAFWSGYGPQVVGAGGRHRWQLETRNQIFDLGEDECIEVHPEAPAAVSGAGRLVKVWDGQRASFFDFGDRLIPRDTPLPDRCVVLLPTDWLLTSEDGSPVEESDEGAFLSGRWSEYRSFVAVLDGHDTVYAGPAANPRGVRRVVQRSGSVRLVGQGVDGLHGPHGEPVYDRPPAIAWPAGAETLAIEVIPHIGTPSSHLVERSAASKNFELGGVLQQGPFMGGLRVEGVDGDLPLLVVPEIDIERPSRPLAPRDRANLILGYTGEDGEQRRCIVIVPPHVLSATLPIPELAEGAVTVALPRVYWSLRSSDHARVAFADGVIRAEAAELDAELRLLVRAGVPATIGVSLYVDGEELQRVDGGPTKASGPFEHHRSIDLGRLRDTIRHHGHRHLEFRLEVNGVHITAIECGDTPVTADQRAWTRQPSNTKRAADTSAIAGLRWSRPDITRDVARDPMYVALKAADSPDAVVTFLRTLGQRQTSWYGVGEIVGPGAEEWRRMDDIADALWGLTGVRHREFSGQERERLRRWAGTRREQCRKAPEQDRRTMEEWLVRHYPDRQSLTNWANGILISDALPNRADITSEWLPGTVLFHIVSLVGGENLSGPVVEEAVSIAPAITLEAVAFVLATLRGGTRITAPPPADDEEEADEEGAEDLPRSESLPVLLRTEGCEIKVTGRLLSLKPGLPCAPPAVRFFVGRKSKAVTTMRAVGGRFETDIPDDLVATLGIQLIDPRAATDVCDAIAVIDVPDRAPTRRATPQRITGLEDLASSQLHALTMEIATLAEFGVYPAGLIEELFDEPERAAAALIAMPTRGATQAEQELALIACLPMSFLDAPVASNLLLRRNILALAVLGPREPSAWLGVGWPNGQAFYSPNSAGDLPGFIHRLAAKVSDTPATSAVRYAPSTAYDNPSRLDRALAHAAEQGTPEWFLDLTVATHRMLTVDRLLEESFRMLMTAYAESAAAVPSAVVAGIATYLACRQ